MADFLEIIKNLLVICCLLATLCATCQQEQENDRLNAQIETLQSVSTTFQECAAVDHGATPEK